MAKTEAASMVKVSETLAQAAKEIQVAIDKSTTSFEKTALKTWKGTIDRVAKDLRELGQISVAS